jgi:hypothetical protein
MPSGRQRAGRGRIGVGKNWQAVDKNARLNGIAASTDGATINVTLAGLPVKGRVLAIQAF